MRGARGGVEASPTPEPERPRGSARLVGSWLGRAPRALAGASFAGLAAATIDAGYARAGASSVAPRGATLLAEVGLVAPLSLTLGVMTLALGLVVDPLDAPSPLRALARLRAAAQSRPAVAALVPLFVLAAFAWVTASAHAARALLGFDASAGLVGVSIALATLALGILFTLSALAVTPGLRFVLANASARGAAFVDPLFTGGAAALLVAALVALGVGSGTVSGDGGVLGIYGILKRPELDLRGPSLAALISLGGFFGPSLLRGLRLDVCVALAVAPLALTARGATSLGREPDVAQLIERFAPVGRPMLRTLRKVTDRDRDGVSALFGGGDCNDRDPRVSPLAPEVVGNGVDDDCVGGDLTDDAIRALAPAPVVVAEAERDKVRKDLCVVLVTVDTLRADLGFAGYPKPVTPNLDALARESVVFEKAYSLASYTGKSVGPTLIGKYGSETHRNWGHFNKFGPEDTFVAERLSKAGISTVSVHAHRYFGNFGGLDRGFGVVDMDAAPPETAKWDVDEHPSGEKLTDAAIRRLDALDEEAKKAAPGAPPKRHFLWVHYLDPHADYVRHAGGPDFGKGERALYDGEVRYTDEQLGRLFAHIKKTSFGARTAIVLTSDHGEAFGEHKMYRHGFELWEELVRVPLVIHVPGLAPRRVAVRRSLIDLAPTLLDLFSLPQPPHSSRAPAGSADFFSGVSLLPDMVGDEPPAPRDFFVDMPGGPYNDARRAFVHGDLKLVSSGGTRSEVYDLARDPGERENLSGTERAAPIESRYAVAKGLLREIIVTGSRK